MIILKRKTKKYGLKSFSNGKILALTFAIITVFLVFWYNFQLSPVSRKSDKLTTLNITAGVSPKEIAKTLKDKSLIRNVTAFDIFTHLSGKRNNLQAGSYRLSSALSSRQIVDKLVSGTVESFDITFFPGATLSDITDRPYSKKHDVTTVLSKAGYTQAEIDYALHARYDSPLFANKPDNTSLEGYIYGETYKFNAGVTVSDIFKTAFDEFYGEISQNNLIQGFAKHGLDLYQGITLASIIEREVSDPEDQRKVAQIFYSRMAEGTKLESDATYYYIANKNGVKRDIGVDSPYNTYKYSGLPPGPIAVPGKTALHAVADPADTSYMYFLSGDDDITYFSYTLSEHTANRSAYCVTKCSES